MGWKPLMLFVGGVVPVGLMLGYANTPGGWYGALNKPVVARLLRHATDRRGAD